MEEERKLNEEEFVLQAIKKLRKNPTGGSTASTAVLTRLSESILEPIRSRSLQDWLLRER